MAARRTRRPAAARQTAAAAPAPIDYSDDPPDEMWTVVRCLNWVAKHLGPIAKADVSEDVPFKFRGIERIMAQAAPLMIAAGIVIVPEAELLSHDPITKGRGGWS